MKLEEKKLDELKELLKQLEMNHAIASHAYSSSGRYEATALVIREMAIEEMEKNAKGIITCIRIMKQN